MKVLFITAEMPFSKAGGLGDVSGSLPVSLKEMKVDIRIISPFYRIIKEKLDAIQYNVSKFQIKGLKKQLQVKIHFINYRNVPVELIDIKEYFDRDGVYTDESGKGFPDNAERYAVFCWSALQHLVDTNWIPDIIHTNDWHTGFIPVWINHQYFKTAFIQNKTKIITTIHNLAYQGYFDREVLDDLGLIDSNTINSFSIYNKLNPLKASINLSDIITTVSPTYSKEIQDEELGAGLDAILRSKSSSVYGILNGVDYDEWNPESDKFLPENYSMNNLSGKKICKDKIIEKFNLNKNSKIPLIGIIGRLVHQKGIDLLIPVLEDILPHLEVSVIIYGSGSNNFEESLKKLENALPEKISVNIEYNNGMAHWVEAASDFFLMPSRYEPCGLNQLFSMRYGTIPIVRSTGGLKDTVKDLRANIQTGTGFIFNSFTKEALKEILVYSIDWFKEIDSTYLNQIRKRIMNEDFSWNRSANEYLELYKNLVQKLKNV